MMRRVTNRHVSPVPSDVIKVLMDVRSWSHWRPGLTHVEMISDDPVLPGTSWIEEHAIGKQKVRLLARVVEIDSPHSFAYTASGDGIEATFRWTLQEVPGYTIIVQQTTARTTGLRHRLSGTKRHLLANQESALDELRLMLRNDVHPAHSLPGFP